MSTDPKYVYIPYREANAKLARDIKSICRRMFPKGKQSGDWWIATVPWRDDKNPSLGVSLTTGHWEDFGRDEKGSPVDLLARMRSREPADIAIELCPNDAR